MARPQHERVRPFGSALTAVRKDRRLTQKEIGQMCGMAQSQWHFYESGKKVPTIRTLNWIITCLHIDGDEKDRLYQAYIREGDVGED